MKTEEARFEILEFLDLNEKGCFIVGNILEGIIQTEMKIKGKNGQEICISAVEYVDKITEESFKIAIGFKEKPELEFLESAFSKGLIIKPY